MLSLEKKKKMKEYTNLNITSLNSELLTNFGSMRELLFVCKIGSLINLIASQPKHVAKISANNSVVPSFYLKKI